MDGGIIQGEKRVILRIALQESNTVNLKYKTVLFIKAFFAKESDTNNQHVSVQVDVSTDKHLQDKEMCFKPMPCTSS